MYKVSLQGIALILVAGIKMDVGINMTVGINIVVDSNIVVDIMNVGSGTGNLTLVVGICGVDTDN